MSDVKKLLIANRGEIAVRVIRACRELGIETVSVYSTEDKNSLHVKLADESVCIGSAKAIHSYLNIPAILSAAEITSSDAIHPGYGFLAENSDFAIMCNQWNILFVGPRPEIIEKMGDKLLSKEMAKEVGVPVLEPIDVSNLSEKEIVSKCKKLGYPVLIKASAGGGGRGMKRVDNEKDVISTIAVLKNEAMAAFGNDTLFIEKFISNPRHIEIQILADNYGNIIHLGERDCTIQRRYQKIIEEAPSPVISTEVRSLMCHDAVKLATHVNYNSVGTIEFLYDIDAKKYYFMEMNTRIQVEHPVTEELTGIDLVSNQIRMSLGDRLAIQQKNVKFDGHVIEFRINAEDPKTSLPSPGLISHYHRPGGPGVRTDDYVYTGFKVSPHYDSLISKIIVKASNRDECINRSLRALNEAVVNGISSNIEAHKQILNSKQFQSNEFNTNFLSSFMLK